MPPHKGYIILVFSALVALTNCDQNTSTLTIAAAANMQYAARDLVQTFTKTTGIPCQLIIGSSGKLAAQIQQGAPFDVFLAADLHYPTVLYQKELTHHAPAVYAHGSLILWTMRSDITPALTSLINPTIRHIAIPNPKTAPYGQAALETLKSLGLLESLQSKLVYGESVGQTGQFITTHAADIGLVAQSIARAPALKNKGHWAPIALHRHPPIAQGAVLLKNRKTYASEAQKFYKFLFSDSSKTILNTFGFTTTINRQKSLIKT